MTTLCSSVLVALQVHEGRKHAEDDVGALYYVVAVIFIYGCSILMMIASYIRKNKSDRKLSRYLKEMASVRKRERQFQLLSATAKAATITQTEKKGLTSESTSATDKNRDCVGKKVAPRLTFSLDNAGPQKLYSDQVYLDLPISSFSYNSDSDNETSTEGDLLTRSESVSSYQRSPSQKSILKKHTPKSVVIKSPSPEEGDKSVVVEFSTSCDRLLADPGTPRKLSLPVVGSARSGFADSKMISKSDAGGLFKDDYQVVSSV